MNGVATFVATDHVVAATAHKSVAAVAAFDDVVTCKYVKVCPFARASYGLCIETAILRNIGIEGEDQLAAAKVARLATRYHSPRNIMIIHGYFNE